MNRRYFVATSAVVSVLAAFKGHYFGSLKQPGPANVGIGTWEIGIPGAAAAHVDDIRTGWHYNWSAFPLQNWTRRSGSEFVPMIWGRGELKDLAAASRFDTILGFNEPDLADQANLSVEEAVAAWPRFLATGRRLGSPSPITVLGRDTWLGRFMRAVRTKGYRVDFIACHHYAPDPDLRYLRGYLEDVYGEYRLPIWLTEWGMVDWTNLTKFTRREQAEYAERALPLLQSLPYVERHAWFAMYPWREIRSELYDESGIMTETGEAFARFCQSLMATS